jgi:hypothetical protein
MYKRRQIIATTTTTPTVPPWAPNPPKPKAKIPDNVFSAPNTRVSQARQVSVEVGEPADPLIVDSGWRIRQTAPMLAAGIARQKSTTPRKRERRPRR